MTPRLNRLLALEARDRVPDGSGGFAETWRERGRVWAEVTARSGRERAAQGAMVSATSCRIVVRAAPEGSEARPTPAHRFREGNRVYVIQSVAEKDLGGRFLTCFAEEEVVA
jgi:head-tail adaptor